MALRVLLNDRTLRGPKTGVGHYVAELIAAMPGAEPEIQLFPFYQGCLGLGRAAASTAIRGTGEKTRRRPGSWGRRAGLMAYNVAMRFAGTWRGCRLYHEPNHIPAPWRGPIVTTIHDLSVLRHPNWHPADRVRWYEREFHSAMSRTRRFISVSEFTRREMVQLLGIREDRITVIPLAPRAIFQPRPAGKVAAWLTRNRYPAHYILYVGTIEPRKNLANVLSAYAGLPSATRRQWALVVVGMSGWGDEDLNELARRYRIVEQVQWAGYVDDAALAWLYAGAKMLVWPSFYEGFGLPPLECMACGTPVVSSRASSIPEVVGDAGLLVEPQDAGQITLAIQRLLEDHHLSVHLSARGLERARTFSWRACATAHARIYRECLALSE